MGVKENTDGRNGPFSAVLTLGSFLFFSFPGSFFYKQKPTVISLAVGSEDRIS
jgi:hypothetical protein